MYNNFNNSFVPPYNSSLNPYSDQLIRVNGLKEAKAYRIFRPNSTVALFDADEDIFYVKSTDESGFSSIRIFKFEEITDMPSESAGEYVTKAEFEAFREEMLNYGKQSISNQRKQTSKSTTDDK